MEAVGAETLLLRRAVAASVRIQAAGLRSLASSIAAECRSLDAIADGIEDGSVDVPEATVPLKLVPLEEDPVLDDEREDVPDAIQTIYRAGDGSLVTHDELFESMGGWLDLFDDRIAASPNFVRAVNEAAENELRCTETTARMVADRTRELDEAGRG